MSPNKRVEIFKVDDDVDTEFDVDDEFAVIRDKLEELGINIQGKEIEVTINECNLFQSYYSLILTSPSENYYMLRLYFQSYYSLILTSGNFLFSSNLKVSAWRYSNPLSSISSNAVHL